MTFSFDITLKEALIIKGKRIYLELLLKQEDFNNLLQLSKNNYKNDYIKTLYAEKPEYVTFSKTEFQIRTKYNRNISTQNDRKVFDRLYYTIKLQSGEIIGTLEMYSSYDAVEFGLFVDQDHSHQGYGTEALSTAIDFIRNNSNITKLKWECDRDNPGSVGVAIKCGFNHQSDSLIYSGRMASCFYLTLVRATYP